jgi:eukaryotic-like serine/threonine-protein kinase
VRPKRDQVLGGRYVLTRQIAMGGMGEVWEGSDLLLSRQVAVKILKDELRTTPAFIERFRAEARHAASLGHPGIATVYDYGETGEIAYLVMELVPGVTLSELLVERPALPTATKLSILSQTAEALHAAHRAGVIHRDVKPANLIVGPDGTVKVTDFGIARAIGAAPLTDAGQVIGTAHYMSPEQATGKMVTSASDIYSLGVIAYEMFAGRRPFEADTPVGISAAHVHSPVPPLPPAVPRGVADLIQEALAKDPASRPSSAEVFALRARREMRDGRPAPTLTMPAAAAATATTVQPAPAPTGGAVGGGMADPPELRRTGTAALLTFLAAILLISGGVWLFATVSGNDASSEASLSSDAAATTELPPSTTLATAAPATTAPVAAAPDPAAPVTAAPTTGPPATTIATTTTVPPATTAGQGPSATVAPPTAATTAAPSTAAPVLDPTPAQGPTDEEVALTFVLTYYEQVAGGEYDATWPSLTQEFRDARNLTFEEYARYWRNTSLELGDLRFTPGPGPSEARVRFAARYDTFGRIVEETDELTLRREQDGRLVITEQRIVS